MRLPDADGLDLVEPLLKANPDLRIIMMTAHGTQADELEAQRRGVHLFVSKSEGVGRIVGAVQNAFKDREKDSEARHLREIVDERFRFGSIITRSAKMQRVFETLGHVVDSRVKVLLQGESGTGKELVARAIHYDGPRRRGPFVAVNCGGIPETLLESELFGHERGAFTGAIATKKGKFELAEGGTLFLDEIAEIPLHLQSKLLRVLQEGVVERIGGVGPRPVDARVISASHRDLIEMVRAKTFREDLYYRLAVFPILLPPLREREGDIALLARHFLDKASADERKGAMTFTPAALGALERHPFPGNVRELENVIARAVLVATDGQIRPEDLPVALLENLPSATPTPLPPAREAAPLAEPTLEKTIARLYAKLDDLPKVDDVEAMLVARAIQLADGNVGEAARALGLSRATLYRRLRKPDAPPE